MQVYRLYFTVHQVHRVYRPMGKRGFWNLELPHPYGFVLDAYVLGRPTDGIGNGVVRFVGVLVYRSIHVIQDCLTHAHCHDKREQLV